MGKKQVYGSKYPNGCPGSSQTEFFSKAEMDLTAELMGQTYENLDHVFQDALSALAAVNPMWSPGGWRNRAIVNANRLAPREILLRALKKAFRPNMPDL